MNDLFKRRKKKAKVAKPAEPGAEQQTAARRAEQAPGAEQQPAARSRAAAAEQEQNSKPVLTFGDLGLAGWLVQACDALGLKRPSAIQRLAIPPALKGNNVLGLAETGSGKTAAFSLPILHRLFEDPYGVFSLILTPSRELASQIAKFLRIIGEAQKMRVQCVIGGEDVVRQSLELTNQRPHIVVGTPGRLVECLDSGLREMIGNLRCLVLDEADRLLENARDDVKAVFGALKKPQVLLYSATSTKPLETFSGALKCIKVEGSKASIPKTLVQEYVFCPKRVKLAHLAQVLLGFDLAEKREEESRGTPADKSWRPRSALVFAQTCRRVHEVHAVLAHQSIDARCLHSQLPQYDRTKALEAFQQRRSQILVCTDVASRGLDLPAIDLVINFDVPRDPDDYIHRVGRCARNGHQGLAVSLITQSDLAYLAAIEGCLGSRLAKCARFSEKSLPLQDVARAVESVGGLRKDRD